MTTKPVARPAVDFPSHWHILALSPQRDLVEMFTSYLNVRETIAFLSSCGTLWDIRSPRFFKHLDFDKTNVTFEIFKDFVTCCVDAETIDMSKCRHVTDGWFEQIGKHSAKLRKINLKFDFREFTTDAGIMHLAKCKKLQEIILGATHFSQKAVSELTAQCPSLRRFKTVFWRAEDALLQALAKLKSFTKLELDSSDITDKGIVLLKGLRTVILEFAKQITSSGIQQLMKNCPGLCEVILSNSPIEDHHLEECTELRVLRLEECPKITLPGIIKVLKNNPRIEVLELFLDINDEWLKQIAPLCPCLKRLYIPDEVVSDLACKEFLVQRPNTILQINSHAMKSSSMREHEEASAAMHRTVSDVNRCIRTGTIAGVITKERLEKPHMWQMALVAARPTDYLRPLLLHPDIRLAFKRKAGPPPKKISRTEKA